MNIFDNITKRVAGTYKTAAKASGELLEETKLRILIVNEQSKVEDFYEKIGEKVYQMYEKGNLQDDQFIDECKEIDSIKQNINSMKNRIKELRNIKSCSHCCAEIDLTFQFCPKCGAKQEAPPEPQDSQILCPQCGTELTDEFEFCPKCGSKKE